MYRTPKPVKDEYGNFKNDDDALSGYAQKNPQRYHCAQNIHFHFRGVLKTDRPLEFFFSTSIDYRNPEIT